MSSRCERCYHKTKYTGGRYRLPLGVILYKLYKRICRDCFIELVHKEPAPHFKIKDRALLFRRYAMGYRWQAQQKVTS